MNKQLQTSLVERFPTLKAYQASKCVQRYVEAVIKELAGQIGCGQRIDKEIPFRCDLVREACGRITINGKKRYVLTVMHEHPSTSLVSITYTGNNITHAVSKAVFNPAFKCHVIAALREAVAAPISKTIELKTPDRSPNRKIPVDLETLQSYLAHTERRLDQDQHVEAYRKKLESNLLTAQAIKARIVSDGVGWFQEEYWEETDCGRTYGQGLSLQCVPKEVRHAALGVCHKYDFKAASYALLTSYALALDPTLRVDSLRDYVARRSEYRKRIAADVGISEAWMKEIFTAVGFGAKTSDNPYSFLRKRLGREKYPALMANIEFDCIRRRFNDAVNVISDHVGDGDFEMLGYRYNAINPKTRIKRTKAQKIAWVYQRLESIALKEFTDMAKQAVDMEPLLTAHDCAYYAKRLPISVAKDIAFNLEKTFNLLRFEHEPITPIGYVKPKSIADQNQTTESWFTFQKRLGIGDQRWRELPTRATFDNEIIL